MRLIIVESPAKADTIEHYLGKQFKVLATYGHLRDLPKRKFGVDLNTFEPDYIVPTKSKKVVSELKKIAKKAEEVYLATDGDREGEAIAWHTAHVLDLKPEAVHRLKFFEITKTALENALAHPLKLDQHLIDAQQARRVLDRLIGYKLSPILWHKVKKGLSAGRVQSVALRLVVDREREVRVFVPEPYFKIWGNFTSSAGDIKAQLARYQDKKLGRLDINTPALAAEITNHVDGKDAVVTSVEKTESRRQPMPPFITSTLQQDASNTLGYSPKKTMIVAQQLYEGVNLEGHRTGLITYMRTDSFHLANEAVSAIREHIAKEYGENKVSEEVRVFAKKAKMAQEAHEAIRPTVPSRTPDSIKSHLTGEQFKVYSLIWKRAIATQMIDARVEILKLKVGVGEAEFEAKGETIIEHGYMAVAGGSKVEALELSREVKEGEKLKVLSYESEKKETEPPARFTAATLIKALEEHGIGRPSTYAPTISTLTDRGYIKIEEKKLIPSDVAEIVTDLLIENFPFVVDVDFTAHLEEDLDAIAHGEKEWKPTLRAFYEPFAKTIDEKEHTIVKREIPIRYSEELCHLCNSRMVYKWGRFGEFLACERFPDCKGTQAIVKHIGVKCPKDGGDVVQRKTRRGRPFYGCANYPKCDFAAWKKPTNQKCSICGSIMLEKSKTELECLDNKHVVNRV